VHHAEFAVRSGSTEIPDRERQLFREKTLFLYFQALERGDLDLVGTILRQAETDEVLEKMIFDLSKSIEAEYLGSKATSHEGTSSILPWSAPAAGTLDLGKVDPMTAAGPDIADSQLMASEIENRADELFHLALDHVEALQYLEAEQYLSQALDLALFIDDPLAVAECAFLFAEIESEMAHDAFARAFCRLGLTMLDAGLPATTGQGQLYDSSIRSMLMSLGQ
jgi:hypothetical protein